MPSIDIIFYALIGGIIPAVIWLVFWLHEDYQHPEPRWIILRTFILGMCAVVIVLPIQKGVSMLIPGMTFYPVLLWVIAEEILKLGAAYIGGLHSVEDNEPIDPLIYMITAALGFVALENALFIFGPLLGDNVPKTVITGNLRFIGASLLHVVSSAVIGFAMAISFYKSRGKKISDTILALIVAIIFHTVFNMAILEWGDYGVVLSFTLVWIAVVVLLLGFEKAKTIAR